MDYSKTVVSPFHASYSQNDLNFYLVQRSDGKVGMVPSNHVKLRGQNTGETAIGPQAQLSAMVRMMDVPDQDETVTANSTKREEVETSDTQVRTGS